MIMKMNLVHYFNLFIRGSLKEKNNFFTFLETIQIKKIIYNVMLNLFNESHFVFVHTKCKK